VWQRKQLKLISVKQTMPTLASAYDLSQVDAFGLDYMDLDQVLLLVLLVLRNATIHMYCLYVTSVLRLQYVLL
jgi:hypothetical protein